MRDNITWIQPVLSQYHINDLWYQGMNIFCHNLSMDYQKETKVKMGKDDILLFVKTMRDILYQENGIKPLNDE